MRNESRNYAVVGLFVIVVALLGVVWIALLSGRGAATDRYFARFANVSGVVPGTKVFFEGFAVGQVERIAPDAGGGFRVELGVQRGWAIPEDSRAEITAPSLLAAFVLNIRAGSSATALAPGSEIAAVQGGGLLASLSTVAEEAASLTEERIGPLIDQLVAATPDLLARLDRVLADASLALENLNRVMTPENADHVGAILAHLDETAARAASTTAALVETQRDVDVLLAEITELIAVNREDIDHSVTALRIALEAFALRAEDLGYNLETTARNLSEFTSQLRENPAVIVRGRAREPEASEEAP